MARESSSHCRAVCLFDDAPIAGALPDRVQDAKADAVAPEGGAGLTVHRENDCPPATPADNPFPEKVNLTLLVLYFEGDVKGIGVALLPQVVKARRHGAPVAVAHRHVDPAENLTA